MEPISGFISIWKCEKMLILTENRFTLRNIRTPKQFIWNFSLGNGSLDNCLLDPWTFLDESAYFGSWYHSKMPKMRNSSAVGTVSMNSNKKGHKNWTTWSILLKFWYMVGIYQKRIRDTEFQNFRGDFGGEKRWKFTHMDINIELPGRFCSNFDILWTLMKGSGILKLFAATLAANNGKNSRVCA